MEALVADEPTNADRLDLLTRVIGKSLDRRDRTQHGKRGKHNGQGAIYN